MNSGINARKTMRKRDRNRVLSGLAYLCGLPLLIALVFVGSIPFMSGDAFAKTKYYGVLICVALWVVMTLVQIIMALVTKNNTARAVVVIVCCVAIMVGGALFFDLYWAKGEVDKARDSYVRDVYGLDADAEIDFADYEADLKGTLLSKYKLQTSYYVPWTKMSGYTEDFKSMVADMERIYKIGYTSSVKGSVNTDGSKYGVSQIMKKDADGNEYAEIWFGEKGAVYKENGLYADGYIFSVPVATEILITYYKTQADFKEQKKDADVELDKALVAAANSSEYKAYQNSAEYKAGEKNKKKYMITADRLNLIISALGQGLKEEKIYDMLTSLSFVFDITEYVSEEDIDNLTLDKAVSLVQAFAPDMTEETIMNLLEGFSSYQMSNVKPVMFFIKDETLRTYAYAKYFGQTHGGMIGSKLIPGDDGKIGTITMDNSGLTAEENAFSLKKLYELRAACKFVPTLYPLFAARRYVYIMAGIVALMYAIFYYAQMKVKLIGIKLERMSQIAGGEY